MIEKIKDDELDLYECLLNPVSFIEILISDIDNMQAFDERVSKVRLGQFSMLSSEYLIDENNPSLTPKENFQLLDGAGTIYNYGSRKYGKSALSLICDMLQSSVLLEGWLTVYSSFDALHVRAILDKLIPVLENHSFFKIFKPHVKRSPTYHIDLANGFVLESVNENIVGKNPGHQWFGYHVKKRWQDESSKETNQVEEKRIDAVHDHGCIVRSSGMTDFTKYSPAGKIFYDTTKKNWLCNFPQYISPEWGEKEKANAVKKYAGEKSTGYKVFVLGEVIEDGIAIFDMQRVRACYDDTRILKNIEIDKNTFVLYESLLVVERPSNCEVLFIAADIGETAATEIGVFGLVNGKYKYLYNITLHGLTDKEQFKIFKLLGEKLKANFIAIDCGDGQGRAIYRSLEEVFDKSNLFWYAGAEKIQVGFDTDEYGNTLMKDGKPQFKEEFMSEYSIQRLKDLFYSLKFDMPLDDKIDQQLNNTISMRSGNRTVYACVNKNNEDHALSMLRVFAMCEWANAFNLLKPINKKKFSKSGV
jgi:hypothetical protein